MPVPSSSPVGAPDAAVRRAFPDELARVAHLFRHTRWSPASQCLVAVSMRPIERFVGALAWWIDGTVGRFQIAHPPGLAPRDVVPALLQSALTAAREAGLARMEYADLLAESSPLSALLLQNGFESLRRERSFEIPYRAAWERVMRLHSRHAREIPSGWRTDSIRQYAPEVILNLVGPHRLLPPDELRQYWQAGVATGFDPELSCVLFDQQRPFGTFLARRLAQVLYIDVQVVEESNALLRSLADVCLLYHGARRLSPDGPVRWLQFRSGQTEHRQTANLARRMGGRELSRMHALGRPLSP
jgi:hypothetical protein